MQVQFTSVLNSDTDAMAVKPGLRVVIDAFKLYLTGATKNRLGPIQKLIKKLKRQKSKLMFTDAVFWTNDRPAALFAIKLGVPVVIRNKSTYYFVENDPGKPIDPKKIQNGIVKACMEDKSITSIAILDSMHDFVRERKDVNFMTKIFKATIESNSHQEYIDRYTQPSDVKNAESAIMSEIVTVYGQVKSDQDIVDLFIRGKPRTGIVFDAGKMPNELRSRRIIGSVRISDPATANLRPYNFESTN